MSWNLWCAAIGRSAASRHSSHSWYVFERNGVPHAQRRSRSGCDLVLVGVELARGSTSPTSLATPFRISTRQPHWKFGQIRLGVTVKVPALTFTTRRCASLIRQFLPQTGQTMTNAGGAWPTKILSGKISSR